MIGLLIKKSGDFLNQETKDYNIIDKMYQRLIQTPEKEEYDPFFRLKLPNKWNSTTEFKTGMVDELKNNLKLDSTTLSKHLENRRWIRPIIKLDCLWYIDGKIYPNIEGHLLKIYNETEKKKNNEKKKSDVKNPKKKKVQKEIKFL